MKCAPTSSRRRRRVSRSAMASCSSISATASRGRRCASSAPCSAPIDREAETRGEPELAVLVVRASDGLPGQGWWVSGGGESTRLSGPLGRAGGGALHRLGAARNLRLLAVRFWDRCGKGAALTHLRTPIARRNRAKGAREDRLMSRSATRFLRTAALAGLIALAACGSGGDNLAAIDNELIANGTDPALTSALEDQIMVDPNLVQQASPNSVRPPESAGPGAISRRRRAARRRWRLRCTRCPDQRFDRRRPGAGAIGRVLRRALRIWPAMGEPAAGGIPGLSGRTRHRGGGQQPWRLPDAGGHLHHRRSVRPCARFLPGGRGPRRLFRRAPAARRRPGAGRDQGRSRLLSDRDPRPRPDRKSR